MRWPLARYRRIRRKAIVRRCEWPEEAAPAQRGWLQLLGPSSWTGGAVPPRFKLNTNVCAVCPAPDTLAGACAEPGTITRSDIDDMDNSRAEIPASYWCPLWMGRKPQGQPTACRVRLHGPTIGSTSAPSDGPDQSSELLFRRLWSQHSKS